MTSKLKSKDTEEIEKMSPALLMRSWNKTMEQVEEAKELNRNSGVPGAENFIQWPG